MEKIDSMICDMKVNPGEDILPIGARSCLAKVGPSFRCYHLFSQDWNF